MLTGLKDIISEAKKKNIAVGSFNTPNLECILAVLDSAEELNVPVIIAHAQCHEDVAPLEKIGPVMIELAKRSKVNVCVHLDHGEDFEYCRRAVKLGFTSVMIDYSVSLYKMKGFTMLTCSVFGNFISIRIFTHFSVLSFNTVISLSIL